MKKILGKLVDFRKFQYFQDINTLLALFATQGAGGGGGGGGAPSALLSPRNGPGIPVFEPDPRLQHDPIAYYRQHGRPVAEGIPISNVNQVVHNTKFKTRERFQIWDAGAESASLRRKDYNASTIHPTTTTTPRPPRTLPPTPPPGAFPNPYMSPWFPPPMYPGFQSPYGYPPPFNPYGGGYPPTHPNYGPRRRKPKPKKTEDVEEGVEDDGSEGTRKETKEGDADSEGTKKVSSDRLGS
ncbi:hypothetical protein ANCCAN_10324, partial [Ancylostoma caninum]